MNKIGTCLMLRRRRREGGVPFLYPSFPVEFSYGKYLLEERERDRDDSSLPRKRGEAGGGDDLPVFIRFSECK